jgi:5-methyltetrahydrofolate--homocysteine methyltransferase
MRDLLNAEDWDGPVSGEGTGRERAHVLDVNVDFGPQRRKHAPELRRLVTTVKIPLMFDSTEWEKMEAGSARGRQMHPEFDQL